MSERAKGDHSPLRDFEEWWDESGLDVYFCGDRRDIKDIAFSVYKAGMERGQRLAARELTGPGEWAANMLAQLAHQQKANDLLERIERHLARQAPRPTIHGGAS